MDLRLEIRHCYHGKLGLSFHISLQEGKKPRIKSLSKVLGQSDPPTILTESTKRQNINAQLQTLKNTSDLHDQFSSFRDRKQ